MESSDLARMNDRAPGVGHMCALREMQTRTNCVGPREKEAVSSLGLSPRSVGND